MHARTEVAPGAFLVGDAVTITRAFRPYYTGPVYPTHVALVVDGTAAMAGDPSERQRADLLALLDGILGYRVPNLRPAVRVRVLGTP